MDDKDIYKGFAPEKQAEYEDWLVERYGGSMRERIDESRAAFTALGKDGMAARRPKAKRRVRRWPGRSETAMRPTTRRTIRFLLATMRGSRPCGTRLARHKPMPEWRTSISSTPTSERSSTPTAAKVLPTG